MEVPKIADSVTAFRWSPLDCQRLVLHSLATTLFRVGLELYAEKTAPHFDTIIKERIGKANCWGNFTQINFLIQFVLLYYWVVSAHIIG